MKILRTSTGELCKTLIEPVTESDYQFITKKRYFFDWKLEKSFEVYKLRKELSNDMLGLVSFERIPSEWRIHVRLLSVSVENKGKYKQYDHIVGNLLTHVAKIALLDYGELACVSLRPKTEIAQHYINAYQFKATGYTLSIEILEIMNLLQRFDYD